VRWHTVRMMAGLKTHVAILFCSAVALLAACGDNGQPATGSPTEGVSEDPGGKIAFASNRTEDGGAVLHGNFDIYVMNADGSDVQRLTESPGRDGFPAWSPDGSRIAYECEVGEICVMNADGTNHVNLTNNPAVDGRPRWSPDGSRIAFISDREGDFDIYVMNSDGGQITNLTKHPAFDGGHSWSPDGSRISFASDRDGNFEIYIMELDGSAPTRLTNNSVDDIGSDWSPDGARIAFITCPASDGEGCVNSGVSWELIVMNVDGSDLTLLADDAGRTFAFPSWSPDSSRIAFNPFRDGNHEIYVIGADGTGLTNITNNLGEDSEPAWVPMP